MNWVQTLKYIKVISRFLCKVEFHKNMSYKYLNDYLNIYVKKKKNTYQSYFNILILNEFYTNIFKSNKFINVQ